jgi:hypothetical protein
MVFYYKIAWMYLMAGDHGNAIKYIHQIINMEVGTLREDIQGYSQLMFIMAHYDAGNEDLLPYLIQTAKNFLNKMQEKSILHQATLDFFTAIIKKPPYERKNKFIEFKQQLINISENKYELRSLLYLDIFTWLKKHKI